MASFPAIEFPNNEIPSTFNKNTFETKMQSDNILTSSLNVLGPSTLNTLTSNTITTSGLITSNGGLNITNGTVSFVNNAIPITAVNGVNTRFTTVEANVLKLQNLTSGNAANRTTYIVSNVLTLDYAATNNWPIYVVPTANFSLVFTNVTASSIWAILRFELIITGKFYCTGVSINGTAMTMTAVGGFANIASSINANATFLIQTFQFYYFNNQTLTVRVNTELKSTW
jgi:hypothetical protein